MRNKHTMTAWMASEKMKVIVFSVVVLLFFVSCTERAKVWRLYKDEKRGYSFELPESMVLSKSNFGYGLWEADVKGGDFATFSIMPVSEPNGILAKYEQDTNVIITSRDILHGKQGDVEKFTMTRAMFSHSVSEFNYFILRDDGTYVLFSCNSDKEYESVWDMMVKSFIENKGGGRGQ